MLSSEHSLGNRMLEVKVATPKVLTHNIKLWLLSFSLVRCWYTYKLYEILWWCCGLYYWFLACFPFKLKEEMRALVKKVARIFVGRIAPSVTEATFRRYIKGDILIKVIGSVFIFVDVVSLSCIISDAVRMY